MAIEVDDGLIEHLASLARLHLTPVEKEVLHRQLGEILEYMARIEGLDPEAPAGIAPDGENPLRDDLVSPSLARDLLLREAPRTDEGFLQVSRILREDGDHA